MRWHGTVAMLLLVFTAGWLSSVSSRDTRTENAVKIMASYDYENTNYFAEETRIKVVGFYNQAVELRIHGHRDTELDDLQSSAEKLKTDMADANARFREKVARTGDIQVLHDYNTELVPLARRMCDIGNKLADYKKQHPK